MEENVIQIIGGIMIGGISVDVGVKSIYMKKIIFGILLNVVAKIEKININDSVITCNAVIEEETKTVTTNFNEKNAICKRQNFCILVAFLLITIA